MAEPESPMAAVLLQLGQLAADVRSIDGREADHWVALRARLREISGQLAPVTAVADGLAAVTALMDGLEARVGDLEDPGSPAGGYSSPPQPAWWAMGDEDRSAAMDRLRSWAGDVYRPGMGKHSGALPSCWENHPACVYILDWLSELWSVLYLQPRRPAPVLSGQAEWWTRFLPAATDLMSAEAQGCSAGQGCTRTRPPSEARR